MKPATYEEQQERLRIIKQQKADADRQYEAMHTYLRSESIRKSECPIKIVPQGIDTPDPLYLNAEQARQVMEFISSLTQKVAFT